MRSCYAVEGSLSRLARTLVVCEEQMSKTLVSIVMGSDSDLEIMREAGKALDEFGIAYEIDVTSAHRSPDRTADFARKAAENGIRVLIAGAGGAAHLAGVVAAHTTLPVIGVPVAAGGLGGGGAPPPPRPKAPGGAGGAGPRRPGGPGDRGHPAGRGPGPPKRAPRQR